MMGRCGLDASGSR